MQQVVSAAELKAAAKVTSKYRKQCLMLRSLRINKNKSVISEIFR